MLTEAQKNHIEELTEKLRKMRPDPNNLVPPVKVEKKKSSYNNYYAYHKKSKSHPDNWRKLGE